MAAAGKLRGFDTVSVMLLSVGSSWLDALCAQLSSELQQHPQLLNGTDSELMQGLLEGNYTIPNTSTLLEQLDTIDNAACGWSHFMSKVSWCALLSPQPCLSSDSEIAERHDLLGVNLCTRVQFLISTSA